MSTKALVGMIVGIIPLVVALGLATGALYCLIYKYFLGLDHAWLVEMDKEIMPAINYRHCLDQQIDLSARIDK
jgi:hypothetical protein